MATKETLKYVTVITVKFIVSNSDVKWLIDKNKILYRGFCFSYGSLKTKKKSKL